MRQAGRQAGRQTTCPPPARETDRKMVVRQTEDRQTDRQTDRQPNSNLKESAARLGEGSEEAHVHAPANVAVKLHGRDSEKPPHQRHNCEGV